MRLAPQTDLELTALGLFDLGAFAVAFSPDGRWLGEGSEVDSERPNDGGQLFRIDLEAPSWCIAGNLERHLDLMRRDDGGLAEEAETGGRGLPGCVVSASESTS